MAKDTDDEGATGADHAEKRLVTIRTSEEGWFKQLATAYKTEKAVNLIDDANTGIDPRTQTLLKMGKISHLDTKGWMAVLVALGMSTIGAGMIVAAILDPEPTSKLGLLVGGGAIIAFSGGFMAIRLLTGRKPPDVTIMLGQNKGFQIKW